MNQRERKTRFVLDLALIALAAVGVCLFLFWAGGAQGATPPPQRTAKAIPAKVAHARQRGRYLARACAPLDYWHVICPERWHP